MLESTEDLIAVFVSLAVLWLVLGPRCNGGRDERGYPSGPEGGVGRGKRPGRR